MPAKLPPGRPFAEALEEALTGGDGKDRIVQDGCVVAGSSFHMPSYQKLKCRPCQSAVATK